jgi:hypothetical protein
MQSLSRHSGATALGRPAAQKQKHGSQASCIRVPAARLANGLASAPCSSQWQQASASSTTSVAAYKRPKGMDFEGLEFKSGGYSAPSPRHDTAWLLSTAGVGAEDDYYDYDEYDDGPLVPNEWDSMEPKFVNNKRVLLNKQIE